MILKQKRSGVSRSSLTVASTAWATTLECPFAEGLSRKGFFCARHATNGKERREAGATLTERDDQALLPADVVVLALDLVVERDGAAGRQPDATG